MTTSAPNIKQANGPLLITQDRVVEIVRFAIKTDGLERAKLLFDMLNTYFSTEPGWPETAMEVRLLFADMREQEEKEKKAEREAERRLAEQKAVTPAVVVVNKNEANAEKNSTLLNYVDQLNGVIEEGAEVIYAKHN
jgi:hypothetical protein